MTFIKKVALLLFCFLLFSETASALERPSYAGLKPYWGDLHNHSAYSNDGPCALPDQAFDIGKARGNDFLAITDHDYNVNEPSVACNLPVEPNKWTKTKESAVRKNENGVFVSLAGFEWTHSPNHINIINSESADAPYSMVAFFDWIARQADKNTIIAQFNHPIQSDLTYFIPRSDVLPIFKTTETNAFWEAYNPFLKKGWKVGAVGYGDSHNINSIGSKTYGLWAEGLTKDKVIEAILNRRTFSAREPAPNVAPSIATALLANGHWMGETINASSFNFEVFVNDPQHKITRIQLLGGNPYTGGTGYHVIKEFTINSNRANITYYFKPSDPKYYRFYYLKVFGYNNANQEQIASLSSPIFVNYNPAVATTTPNPTKIPSSPTNTPTPTVAAVSTPTPTSILVSNNQTPVITALSSYTGTVGRSFSVTVDGYDLDLGDKLIMKLYNPAPGLSLGYCSQSVINGKKTIKCPYAGTPTTTGKFYGRIILNDGKIQVEKNITTIIN